MPKISTKKVGDRFERLIITKELGRGKHGRLEFECLCDCGNTKIVRDNNLHSGDTKSCGCLAKELKQKRLTTHGHSARDNTTSMYITWGSMKQRCYDKNHESYTNYGGRGIKICKRWMDKEKGFENFLLDMGDKPIGSSIDRINNNKGYYKNNCRWATAKMQASNTRKNVYVKYLGRRMTFSEACRISGVHDVIARRRMNKGLPETDWFVKLAHLKPKYEYKGKRFTAEKISKMLGMSLSGFKKRLKAIPEDQWQEKLFRSPLKGRR